MHPLVSRRTDAVRDTSSPPLPLHDESTPLSSHPLSSKLHVMNLACTAAITDLVHDIKGNLRRRSAPASNANCGAKSINTSLSQPPDDCPASCHFEKDNNISHETCCGHL